MQNKRIYIVKGPIHSGKTTNLKLWLKAKDDVFGVFSPVINGIRYFENAATGNQFTMEAEAYEMDVLQVGKYTFSKSAFKRAEAILSDAIQKHQGWVIVDEIGPLELKGKGLSAVTKRLLEENKSALQVILVIRESILLEAIQYFEIDNLYKILDL